MDGVKVLVVTEEVLQVCLGALLVIKKIVKKISYSYSSRGPSNGSSGL